MPMTKISRAEKRAREKTAGITRYIGKVCKKHPDLNGERAVNNRKCVGCRRDYMAKYLAKYMKAPAYKAHKASAQPIRARIRNDHISKFATPKWLTDDDKWMIREIYNLRALRDKLTGIKWHVDHEIPLKGKFVCGLHVPTNLQVLTGADNVRKGNCHR